MGIGETSETGGVKQNQREREYVYSMRFPPPTEKQQAEWVEGKRGERRRSTQ